MPLPFSFDDKNTGIVLRHDISILLSHKIEHKDKSNLSPRYLVNIPMVCPESDTAIVDYLRNFKLKHLNSLLIWRALQW